MFIVTGLRHQHAMSSGSSFDEVMRANICHNLCSGINLSVQLLLQLPDGLKNFIFDKYQFCCDTGTAEEVPSRQDFDPS
jgi:hypothetical protein